MSQTRNNSSHIYDVDSVTPTELVGEIKRNGGVLLCNFVSAPVVNAIVDDMESYMLETSHNNNSWEAAVFPKETTTTTPSAVTCALERSQTYTDNVVMHPLWRSVIHSLFSAHDTAEYPAKSEFLKPEVPAKYVRRGSEQSWCSSTSTLAESEVGGLDETMGLFVVGTTRSGADCATRVTLRPSLETSVKPVLDECEVEMSPGDAIMVLKSSWQRPIATTTDGEEGLMLSAFATGEINMTEHEEELDVNLTPELLMNYLSAAQKHFGWEKESCVGRLDFNVPCKPIRNVSANPTMRKLAASQRYMQESARVGRIN